MSSPHATTLTDPTVEGFAIEVVNASHLPAIEQRLATILPTGWLLRAYGDRGVDFEVSVPGASQMTMAEAWDLTYRMKALPGIAHAEPLFAVTAPEEEGQDFEAAERGDDHLPESDPLDWSVELANVRHAWQLFAGREPGAGVLVGHPDTGFRPHDEIASQVRSDLDYDFVDDDDDATDDLSNPGHVIIHNPGHGTATASVIVSGKPGQIHGIAPGAQIIPFRVARSVVVLSTKNLARAIELAADRGAHVISMSMGGLGSRRLRNAVSYAQRRGVIVCAAAGNKVGFVVFPAAYDEVIACAACNARRRPWSGSSRGRAVDITAPGESVWRASVRLNDDGTPAYSHGRGSGTSYAVANVAGVAALWLSFHGRDALVARYGAERIPFIFNDILRATAQPRPEWGPGYGAGLLDARAVLAAPLPADLESAGYSFTAECTSAATLDTGGLAGFEHLFDIPANNGFETTDGYGRLQDVLAQLLGVPVQALPRRLKEIGHELAVRLATDPQLYQRIAELVEGTEISAEANLGAAIRLLDADASPMLRERLRQGAESAVPAAAFSDLDACDVELSEHAVRHPAARGEAELPAAFESVNDYVGLGNVPADKVGDGYNAFRIRMDLHAAYLPVLEQVRALGGIITSSGGIRDLAQRATPGRSRTSLHYTGRALDLYIYSGMQSATDPYLVVPAGGSANHPLWHVYCVSKTPQVGHPAYDAALIREGELLCAVWRKHKGYELVTRVVRYFSLTDIFARYGWQYIPARADWRTNYLSCEWWHFQHQSGLVSGQTKFGAELLRAWPAQQVSASGLSLDAVWGNQSFRSV